MTTTNDPFDRPVWASLCYAPALAEGDALARRYRRDIHLFASTRDDSDAASVAALTPLVAPGETVFILQAQPAPVPPGLQALRRAEGVQMLAMRPVEPEAGAEEVIELGDADAADMLALAQLTEPGPFLPRTHTMGRFVGIRVNGQLAAMAGERMRFEGGTEVSGVCTHPEFRGHGFARRLSSVVAHAIQQRGDQAFLHAWTTNAAAIALYESLGFRVRTAVHVAVLGR